MAYENTHLWAANQIIGRIKDDVLKKLLTENIDDYYFGAIFPDTLSYSKEKEIKAVGGRLHSEAQTISGGAVFDCLDRSRNSKEAKDLAFTCGYLTHCAMDIVLHPMVVYFSGYKPVNTPRQAVESDYLHWHYETCIDRRFNETFFVDKVIRPAAAESPLMASVLNISGQIVSHCLKRQITLFKHTRHRFPYIICRLLYKVGMLEKKYLGGFYANLDADHRRLPEHLQYRDIISGEKKEISLDALMEHAIDTGLKMVAAAYDYYCGKISRQVCEGLLGAYNLDTGESGKSKIEVKYSADIEL